MWQRALSVSGGGGGTTIEGTAVLSASGGIVFDTDTVSSVKIKFTSRNSSGDTVRINVSNSAYSAVDLYHYGSCVKTYSSIMSDYVDLLALSEVSGYKYIALCSDRNGSNTIVDMQIS